jgi:ribosome-associated protein
VPTLTLQDDSITLAQALKASGIAETGGRAKQMVRGGQVRVNGAPESQPGRKLVIGDQFAILDSEVWTIAGKAG